MNARHTGTGRTTLRVTALGAIALIVSFGGTTGVLAQTSVVFSQRLQPTDEDQAPEPRAGPSFGAAVAISGTTVLVGMPTHNDRLGRVGVYVRKEEGWVRQATISDPEPQRRQSFGRDLSISLSASQSSTRTVERICFASPTLNGSSSARSGAAIRLPRSGRGSHTTMDSWRAASRLSGPTKTGRRTRFQVSCACISNATARLFGWPRYARATQPRRTVSA